MAKHHSNARKRDLYQEVTDSIITSLEAGTAPWVRPWRYVPGESYLPTNAATGRNYQGINVPLLWGQAQHKGYESNQWMTFQQARKVGAHVRRGEKSTLVIFFKPYKIKELGDDGTEREKMIPLIRSFSVFNRVQIDGLPTSEPAPISEWKTLETVDQAIANTGAVIRHAGNSAFFSPTGDFINMPAIRR